MMRICGDAQTRRAWSKVVERLRTHIDWRRLSETFLAHAKREGISTKQELVKIFGSFGLLRLRGQVQGLAQLNQREFSLLWAHLTKELSTPIAFATFRSAVSDIARHHIHVRTQPRRALQSRQRPAPCAPHG